MNADIFSVTGREASRSTAFSGNLIKRDSENRSDDSVDIALDSPDARVLLIASGRLFLRVETGGFLARFTRAEAAMLGAREAHAVLLGQGADGPVLAIPSAIDLENLPENIKAIDFRSIYAQGLLDRETLGELAQGAALLAWHANHRHCGRCGARSQMRAGGYKRSCPSCSTEVFPRTDPVAIMLAVRDGKCLLGRSPHFPPGMYSCLAGFIEPGETIEDAVRRETFEESGIRIGRVAYHASQPWPFPYSLMIGCYGEALTADIHPDLSELEDCRWFDRAEVRAVLERAQETVTKFPPPGAIASVLLRGWAGIE